MQMRASSASTSAIRASRAASVVRAQVEAERAAAGDDVDRPVRHLEHADGADHVGHRAGAALDEENELGGGSRRVAPAAHRRRSRVACHADDLAEEAHAAVDRRDDAERQVELASTGPCSMWISTKPR